MNHEATSTQAVVVDYKVVGCKSPGNGPNSKKFIQYTLEWLLIERFNEIYVCCLPDNAAQMREIASNFLRTENCPKTMIIQVHSSENNRSTGDCLRDLDAKGLIKSDFVIMDVGCCGNLSLSEHLNTHKALRKVDKSTLLTTIVRNVFTKNPAEIGEFPIYITDPKTGLLLHYTTGRVSEKGDGESQVAKPLKSFVDVPSEIFLSRGSVKIHTNLCSTNLSIYSANVPALFAELFDCHSEAELIQAIFDNEEVLGGSIYVSVVDDLFSQRMADFGFAINQKWDKFDTNLIYKRNDRYQVLRQLVNDSLINCTKLNSEKYLAELPEDDEPVSESSSDTDSDEHMVDDDEAFLYEVLDSLVRGYEESIKNENLVLEVNSSKHAYNIDIDDVFATVAKALLMLPDKLSSNKPTSISEYWNVLNGAIDRFERFLLNYTKNENSKGTVISTMEDYFHSEQCPYLNETVLAKIYHKLYEIDAFDEKCIIDWYKNYNSTDQAQKNLRSKPAFKQLVEALEADSEDDDDSE